MRLISITHIIAVVLALTASSASAGFKIQEMRSVYGFGTLKCGFWVDAYDSGNKAAVSNASHWVAGYMTGLSLSRVAQFKNVLGTTTPDELWAQIERDCRRSPNVMFGGAVELIVKEIESGTLPKQ